MSIFKERRRLLVSELSKSSKGQIIITAADSTNYVKVGDVTYTAPAVIPIEEEIRTDMYVGINSLFGSFLSGKSFSWIVEGTTHSFAAVDKNGLATFKARVGHIYTIDAVNKTISVEIPKDWDGIIFDSYQYIYAPFTAKDGTVKKVTDAGYLYVGGVLTLGPIDITNFNYFRFKADSDYGFRAYLYDFQPSTKEGSITGDYFFSEWDSDAGNGTCNLSNRTGNIWIQLRTNGNEAHFSKVWLTK